MIQSQVQSNKTSKHDVVQDVVIIGAGPIGMVAALLLAQQGGSVVVIEKNSTEVNPDGRYLALSYGSLDILKEALRPYDLSLTYEPILQVHTSMAEHRSQVVMDCADHRLNCLGGVLAYTQLMETLRAALAMSCVEVLWSTQVVDKTVSADRVSLTLRSALRADVNRDEVREAQWVIHAEGGLFNQQTQQAQHRSYEQTAIVALVDMAHAPKGVAFERFTRNGPIALLPTNMNQYVSIWTAPHELVKELLSLSDDQYLLRLQYFYKELAGDFLAIKPRFEFNLGLNARDVIAQDRSFFMGNSAQTIHPFAGQGFNLGLRDVVVWVDLWAAKKTPTNELEARYIAMRQRDRKTTIKLIDSIVTLFRRPHYISQYGLAILLEMCELKPVKTRLSRLMMFGRR